MNTDLKKIRLNSIISILSQIVTLILGLIIPRIILINYGSDTNGLTNTISQIFVYVALLETGISTSARNALYKPIQDNDYDAISYWVSLARRYFRRISLIYSIIILICCFVAPFLLKTHVSYWTIFFYMLFEGLTSVVSFYFLNTWTCFLNSKGENYIVNIVSLISKLLMYGIKIVLYMLGFNIVLIQVGYFIVSLVQVFIYMTYMKKHYPWINYKASPSDAKLPDKNSYLLIEIAWTVFSSTDMIILSTFVSTELSSVYSIYNMVFVAINGVVNSLFVALNYNLGCQFKANREQYIRLHDIFNNIFIGGVTALMCVTYFLLIPFIEIYTKGVHDVNYIYSFLPFLFCSVQILSWSRMIASNLFGIAGHAKSNAIASIVESALNVCLSIIFVNIFGIVGVLLATVVSLIPKVIFLNVRADVKILKRSNFKTLKIFLCNSLVFIGTVLLKPVINLSVHSYIEFCIYGFVLVLIYLLIIAIVNCLTNRDLFFSLRKIISK